MKKMKKVCTGWDDKPHEAYIYKNIDGKKYCQSCAYKLQPPTKISKKKFKIKPKSFTLKEANLRDLDNTFYLRVWEERFYINTPTSGRVLLHTPKCEYCGKTIRLIPTLVNFHHILEKRNYEEYRHNKDNIMILCEDCHMGYETFPTKYPSIVERKEKMLEKYKLEYGKDI